MCSPYLMRKQVTIYPQKRTSMDAVRTCRQKQSQIQKGKSNQDKEVKALPISSILPIPRHVRAPPLDKEHNSRI
jgi:hypothetical protein